MIRLDGGLILGQHHGHDRVLGQQIRHQAFVIRINMMHQHKGGPRVGRHRVQERTIDLQAAGRSTKPNNRNRALRFRCCSSFFRNG